MNGKKDINSTEFETVESAELGPEQRGAKNWEYCPECGNAIPEQAENGLGSILRVMGVTVDVERIQDAYVLTVPKNDVDELIRKIKEVLSVAQS